MSYAGKEVTIEVGGKSYRLARYDVRIVNEAVKWAASRLPDPIKELKEQLPGLPESVQNKLVDDAISRKAGRREFNSPEIQSELQSPEGAMHIFYLLLRKYQPHITEDEVSDLFFACLDEYGPDYINNKVGETYGKIPQSETKAEKEALQQIGALPKDPFLV